MSEKTIDAINEARDYFNEMLIAGFVSSEMITYKNKVEEVFETLGIKPEFYLN